MEGLGASAERSVFMQILTYKPFPETDGEVTAYLHTPIMEMGKRREIIPAVVV